MTKFSACGVGAVTSSMQTPWRGTTSVKVIDPTEYQTKVTHNREVICGELKYDYHNNGPKDRWEHLQQG